MLFCIKPAEQLSLDGDNVTQTCRRTILADSRHIDAPGTLEDALRRCFGCGACAASRLAFEQFLVQFP